MKIVFNLRHDITTVLAFKKLDRLIYDYTFEFPSSIFALLMAYLIRK